MTNYVVHRSDELTHSGRKGMKWYQHIYTSAQEYAKGRRNKKKMAKVRAAKTAKQKEVKKSQPDVKKLSDDELKQRIARLQLEKQYRDLNPQQISTGQKFVKEFKDKAAKDLSSVASTQLKNYVEKKIKAKLGDTAPRTDLSALLRRSTSDLSNAEIRDAVQRITQERLFDDYRRSRSST